MNRDKFGYLNDEDKLERIFTALALLYDEVKKISEHSVVDQREDLNDLKENIQRDMMEQWKENNDRNNEDLR